MRKMMVMASLLALVACGDKDDSGDDGSASGGNLCEDYLNALDSCYQDVGFSLADFGIDSATYCDAYDGVDTYNSLFQCYIDEISAADCATEEGVTAMNTALATCS